MMKPKKLGENIRLIDLFDLELEQRTGCYLLEAEKLTLIETSASPSIPHLINGLEQLNISLEEIKYIIVTHIHLDHAGGVGLLLEKCPNAHVVVHPRGKRHLADPTKLIQGAKAVYAETFDQLFDPIVPVPEARIITKEDGETLRIGKERFLTFYDTPGHANHHFSIYDSCSQGMFTGDTLGIRYPTRKLDGLELILPSTSPNQFDPDVMIKSLERIQAMQVKSLFFGHYGKSDKPQWVFDSMRYWLPKYLEVGAKVMVEYPDASFEQKCDRISTHLFTDISNFLNEKQITIDPEIYTYIKFDLQICAMGMVDYYNKNQR